MKKESSQSSPPPTTPASPGRWTGWHRRRGERWHVVAGADSEVVAWQLLDAAVSGGDKSMLLAGVRPWDPLRPQSSDGAVGPGEK